MARHAPEGSDNLVLRAACALKEKAGFAGGAAIRLEKHLPAGAGFGGGSADAAATLHALNELWALGLDLAELSAVARTLGADVPMCLLGSALRARGTGDRIDTIDGWPPLHLVLVWPGKPLSTAAVFGKLGQAENRRLPNIAAVNTPEAISGWLSSCRNDLEEPALHLLPEIGDVLEIVRTTEGCVLARMSGSGSGCFGLYATRAEAKAAAKAVQNLRLDWWVAATEAR